MILSISCRIAEGFLSKKEATLTFSQLADLAVESGYDAICMRASQIGIHTPPDEVAAAREMLSSRNLGVTMISGDFPIVYNNDQGPDCLRNITPYLDLAEALEAPMIRVALKSEADIEPAQRAVDEAAERGLTLVHQCHVQSIFETVDEITDTLNRIDRPNFRLIFEAANLEQCGQSYGRETISRLAPWISNVYFQNQEIHPAGAVTLTSRHAGPVSFDIIEIPDSGGIRFDEIFDGLREVGYDGPVTVHQSAPEDPGLSSAQSAKATADFLKQLCDK